MNIVEYTGERKETMQALVKDEAKKLRNLATKEEYLKLNFGNLSVTSKFRCVYGQMTGDCFSKRASELIFNCCSRVYNSESSEIEDSPLNGKPSFKRETGDYWSPIEVFIVQPENKLNGNNERLVKYIKGEVETLEFV